MKYLLENQEGEWLVNTTQERTEDGFTIIKELELTTDANKALKFEQRDLAESYLQDNKFLMECGLLVTRQGFIDNPKNTISIEQKKAKKFVNPKFGDGWIANALENYDKEEIANIALNNGRRVMELDKLVIDLRKNDVRKEEITPLRNPNKFSLIDIFEELKYGRPKESQEYLDKCIQELHVELKKGIHEIISENEEGFFDKEDVKSPITREENGYTIYFIKYKDKSWYDGSYVKDINGTENDIGLTKNHHEDFGFEFKKDADEYLEKHIDWFGKEFKVTRNEFVGVN